MYFLKPVHSSQPVTELPSCMYTLKPVCSLQPAPVEGASTLTTLSTTHLLAPEDNNLPYLQEMNDEERWLTERQAKVLQQLAELKQELLAMRSEMKLCMKPAMQSAVVSKKAKIEPINLGYLQDFVVNASPAYVPYSLLALKKLWLDRLDLHVECFTHSTVPELTADALRFQDAITALAPNAKNLPQIKVTLIWKNVGTYTEMITSPTSYVPICGEVNILRFLSRCGPSEFNYELLGNVTEADLIFDACYLLINKANVKQKQQVLKVLNGKLGKMPGYGGPDVSLCDIAVTSALKQVQRTMAKDINANLVKYIGRVSSTMGL